MTTLRALRKLVLGETVLLPLGVAAVVATCALLLRPLTGQVWSHLGGFVLLAGVVAVLMASVARGAGERPNATARLAGSSSSAVPRPGER